MWTPDAYDIIADDWRTVTTWCSWLTDALGAELLEAAQPSRRGGGDQ
jgi:hypothetical protein